MQLRLLPALTLFLASYLPLSLILLVQNLELPKLRALPCWPGSHAGCEIPLRNPMWSLGMVAVTTACLLITIIVLWMVRPKKQINIKEVKYIPTDLMNYTLPYVVSFMSIDYQDSGKFVGFGVFILWMFWISYKSGQILMNPVLIAMSWRLYEVKHTYVGSSVEHIARALVKGELAPGKHEHSQVQDLMLIKRGT